MIAMAVVVGQMANNFADFQILRPRSSSSKASKRLHCYVYHSTAVANNSKFEFELHRKVYLGVRLCVSFV